VKKRPQTESLTGEALIKEVNRRIRLARSYWDAHRNSACRTERERALQLYNALTKAEKEKIPQVRYRSEKYFNETRTPPRGGKRKGAR
jgi:isopropylmalate/homocitrate/citramalate synthase